MRRAADHRLRWGFLLRSPKHGSTITAAAMERKRLITHVIESGGFDLARC
jgi:hypothetical protein